MSLYYPGCTTSQADPVCSDCPSKELGDIRHFAFVKATFAFTDISDAAEWAAGINSKDIYAFPFGRGTLEMTPNLQPGFGDQIETLDGYEFDINVSEPNYKDNCNFWNDIKRSKEWNFAYLTETQVHLTDSIVLVVPTAPIGDDKKQSVIWNANVKFSQEDIPCPSNAPVGTFEECISVN